MTTTGDANGVHWTRSGNGPPILFIQGVGVHGDGWRPQIEAFAATHTCIAFDHRGVGRSPPPSARPTIAGMANDALAVLDAAAGPAARAHVVGHSLGGQVALQFALQAPQRVRSLSLLCTFADGRKPARGPRMFWLGLRANVGTARMRRRAFLQIVLPKELLRGADRDALAAHYAPLFGHDLARSPRVAMAQIGAFRRCDLTADLPRLAAIPTLVVAAAQDVIAPPPLGRAIAQGIPGARFVELTTAAHGAPLSHAPIVDQLLRTHLDAHG